MSKTTSSLEFLKNKPSDIQTEHTPKDGSPIASEKLEDNSFDEIIALTLRTEYLEKVDLTFMANMSNLRHRSDEDMKRNRLYSNHRIMIANLRIN